MRYKIINNERELRDAEYPEPQSVFNENQSVSLSGNTGHF